MTEHPKIGIDRLLDENARMRAALEKAVEVRQWQKAYFQAIRGYKQNAQGILIEAKAAEAALDKMLEEFTPKLEPEAQRANDKIAGKLPL